MKNLLFPSKNLKRKEIRQILTKAIELPLIMVVAPMGFGKTTAIQEFLGEQSGKKIWIPFGQNEVDAVWIWHRLCDKFQRADYPFVDRLREVGLPENQYEINAILDILYDKFQEDCYVILDDFHECENSKLMRFIESAAYARIPNLHIFLLSRTYPAISYDELWMKNLCVLVGQSALALDREEIRDFFEINGVALNPEEEGDIYQYTEGWMSAVYLVLMDYLENGSFHNYGGINNLVRNFIYGRISENCKHILMLLSPLDAFTIEQAVYVTRIEECSSLIPQMSVSIGFLEYNPNTGCYSVHDVLRAVVRSEFEESSIDKNSLYNRIGEWYESVNFCVYAIQYYDKGENINAIFRLIEQYKCTNLLERAPAVMENFFQKVDRNEAMSHPLVYLPYLWDMVLRTDISRCKERIEEAKAYYETHSCKELTKKQLLGELYLVQWNLEFNNLDKMTECAVKASELLENQRSTIFSSNFILTFGAPETLFLYHRTPGDLKHVVELEKCYTKYYMRLLNGVENGWDFLVEGEYLFTTGEVEKADKLSDVVREKSVVRHQGCIIISSYFLKMRCQIFLGRKERFEELAAQLSKLMEQETNTTIRMDYDMAISYLYGCIGQTEKISPWLSDFDIENCNRIIRSVRGCCVVYGMALIKKQEWMRLEVLADEMSVPYSVSKHMYAIFYAEIYYAISSYHLYGMEEGKSHLKKVFDLARLDGIRMPFVDYILHIEPMLEELKGEDIFACEILELGVQKKKGMEVFGSKYKEKDSVKERMVALTEREREMMLLVAKGYKNSEIGNEMNIALVTVEKKLTAVYRKLCVTNRTAALRVLREYGVLE